MVQCKKCKLFVSMTKDDIVKCKGGCEGIYHKKCVRNYKQFAMKEKCEECSNGNSGSTSQINLNPSEESGERILAEVNRKLEVIYNMEKKLVELAETVDFYAEMYQNMTEFKEVAEKKIKILEQKNTYLEKCNRALEERLEELEMKEKEKYIEISGLENKNNEDTIQVVKEVAKILQLDPEDVEEAERIGKAKEDDSRPRIIQVKLRTKNVRAKWMAAKKGFSTKNNKITNNLLYHNGNDSQIFINESLPKFKRQLLWMTRSMMRPKGYQYIWVQNGNILVKKNNEEKRIYNIKSEQVLNDLEEAYNSK